MAICFNCGGQGKVATPCQMNCGGKNRNCPVCSGMGKVWVTCMRCKGSGETK